MNTPLRFTLFLPFTLLEKLGITDRRALRWGAGLLLLGLALVGAGPSDVGAGLTVVGLAVLIYGIHGFGRLGPDGRARRLSR